MSSSKIPWSEAISNGLGTSSAPGPPTSGYLHPIQKVKKRTFPSRKLAAKLGSNESEEENSELLTVREAAEK